MTSYLCGILSWGIRCLGLIPSWAYLLHTFYPQNPKTYLWKLNWSLWDCWWSLKYNPIIKTMLPFWPILVMPPAFLNALHSFNSILQFLFRLEKFTSLPCWKTSPSSQTPGSLCSTQFTDWHQMPQDFQDLNVAVVPPEPCEHLPNSESAHRLEVWAESSEHSSSLEQSLILIKWVGWCRLYRARISLYFGDHVLVFSTHETKWSLQDIGLWLRAVRPKHPALQRIWAHTSSLSLGVQAGGIIPKLNRAVGSHGED